MTHFNLKNAKSMPINSEYGILPTSPKSPPNKILQRKQQPNFRGRVFNNEKRRKEHQNGSKDKICFLPSVEALQIQKIVRSKSNLGDQSRKVDGIKTERKKTLDSAESKRKREANRREKMREIEDNGNQTSKSAGKQSKRKQKFSCQEENINRSYIEQLSKANQQLDKEVKKLLFQIEVQKKKIESLNGKVTMLTEANKQYKKKLEEKGNHIKILQNNFERQKIKTYQVERELQFKENELKSIKNRQGEGLDFDEMFLDIKNNFAEFQFESKTPQLDSMMNSRIESQLDSKQEQILNLKDRIKKQEVEITMLKRYKYEKQQCNLQLNKEKNHNKILLSRLKSLSNELTSKGKVKTLDDSSILFELSLSKDQISTTLP